MASFETVNGQTITAMMDGDILKIKDASGNISSVSIADVHQSNGVVHVVDTVFLPKM